MSYLPQELNNSYGSTAKLVPEEMFNQKPKKEVKKEKAKLVKVQQLEEEKPEAVKKPDVQKKEEEKHEANKLEVGKHSLLLYIILSNEVL